MKKSKWDIFLTKEAKEYYAERCEETPRQWAILEIIMNNKTLKDLPFKPIKEDIEYYERSKKEYEEMKKANPGEEVYFKYVAQ